MFAIVISEKGGAERREAFEQTEIGIGRVQGNELLLPKGNVSKKHARLLYREGRFIVTDLNSTNGTYVNRRRISQATIVREGDRIYIGDFVLRIEVSDQSEPVGSGRVERPVDSEPSARPDEGPVSHYPLERDPDESGAFPEVPGAPRLPSVGGTPSSSDASSGAMHSSPEVSRTADRSAPIEPISEEAKAHRASLADLLTRVTGAVDLSDLDSGAPPSKSVERAVKGAVEEHVKALRGGGQVPAGVDLARLGAQACAELLDLGPLRSLLQDAKVTEIHVPAFDTVLAVRDGRQTPCEPPFATPEGAWRSVARIAQGAGSPIRDDETVVHRRLQDGGTLVAARGGGRVLLTISKPHVVSGTLESLVRSGTISRAMATFFQCCTVGRANILLVGPRDASTSAVLGAFVAATDGPLVAVLGAHDVVGDRPSTNRVTASERPAALGAIEVAARMPGVRLVVDELDGPLALAVLDAIGQGAEGVVAVARCASLRRALDRLPSDLSAAASSSARGARDLLAASFDVAVEVSRLRDGRARVLRVAELGAATGDGLTAQDVFTFTIERRAAGGAVEGTFHASGRVPRIADDMAVRGVPIESSLFTRPPSR